SHPEILQRFRVVVIGNNGQECAAAIERAPRIEREALMFEQQRLGNPFWKFPHPRDAAFLQGVVWAVGASRFQPRFPRNFFEVTQAILPIHSPLHQWIPTVTQWRIVSLRSTDPSAFICVEAERDAHRLPFCKSSLTLFNPSLLIGVVTERVPIIFPGHLLLN